MTGMKNKETYKEHMAYLISKGHDWFDHKKDLPANDKQAPTTEATRTKENK